MLPSLALVPLSTEVFVSETCYLDSKMKPGFPNYKKKVIIPKIQICLNDPDLD